MAVKAVSRLMKVQITGPEFWIKLKIERMKSINI